MKYSWRRLAVLAIVCGFVLGAVAGFIFSLLS